MGSESTAASWSDGLWSQRCVLITCLLVPWCLCLTLGICLYVALEQRPALSIAAPAALESVARTGAACRDESSVKAAEVMLPPSRGLAEQPSHAGEEAEVIPQEEGLSFLFIAIGAGTVVMQVSTVPRFAWLQETVVLFVLGLLYTAVVYFFRNNMDENSGIGTSWMMWMDINPDLLLSVMLPILITGDSISIDTSLAKRVAKQCIYLAGPGVLVGSFIMAVSLDVFLVQRQWSFIMCLTVSSILAATDPVATVGLLKELGASPSLTVQIQGESLLNDGMAMVLFSVAYRTLGGEVFTAGGIVIFLVRTVVCAVLIGLSVGLISVFWIRFAADRLDYRSSIIQISITICCPYVAWIWAESIFEVSGVLCVVSAALVLADKMWPSVVETHAMHNVWHTLEFMGNSVIFFVAGALTGTAMIGMDVVDYFLVFFIYVICMVVRGALLFASIPILNMLKEPSISAVTFSDATVMTWGGLRGALGLALAIKVRQDLANGTLPELEGKRVLFYVGGIAFLTLVVNATSSPRLVKALRLNSPDGSKQILMINLHQSMMDMAEGSDLQNFDEDTRELLSSMLDEVQQEISMVVDRSVVEIVDSTRRSMAEVGAVRQSDVQPPRDSGQLHGVTMDLMAEHYEQMDAELNARSSWDLWGKKHAKAVFDGQMLPKARDVCERWATARKAFLRIPDEERAHFRVEAVEELMHVRTLQYLLKEEGDLSTSKELQPVNDIFIQLLGKQIEKQVSAGDLLQSEQDCLKDCVAEASLNTATKLTSLFYLRLGLIKMHRHNKDMEALAEAEGVALPGKSTSPSAPPDSVQASPSTPPDSAQHRSSTTSNASDQRSPRGADIQRVLSNVHVGTSSADLSRPHTPPPKGPPKGFNPRLRMSTRLSLRRHSLDSSGPLGMDPDPEPGIGSEAAARLYERRRATRKFVESIHFIVLETVAISINTALCVFVALSGENGTAGTEHAAIRVVSSILFCVFIGDVAIKTFGIGPNRYLKDGWNRLDLIMTVVGIAALVVECLEASPKMGGYIFNSPIAQVYDALIVLQLPRVHHFAQIWEVKELIQRRALSDADPHQAGRVQASTILMKFVEAHIIAQGLLLRYFGRRGQIDSSVVARVVTESMTEVYKACWMSYRTWLLIDKKMVTSLRDLSHAMRATLRLVEQVEEAHDCGCLTDSEAEKLNCPMARSLKYFIQLSRDRHRGVMPNDTSECLSASPASRHSAVKNGNGDRGRPCCMVDLVQSRTSLSGQLSAFIFPEDKEFQESVEEKRRSDQRRGSKSSVQSVRGNESFREEDEYGAEDYSDDELEDEEEDLKEPNEEPKGESEDMDRQGSFLSPVPSDREPDEPRSRLPSTEASADEITGELWSVGIEDPEPPAPLGLPRKQHAAQESSL